MKDYDGPVYKQGKGDDSIKQRRFNRLSQLESAKTQFKPALKQRRPLETTIEFDASYPIEGQRSRSNQSDSDSNSSDASLFSKQLEKRSGSFDQHNQRPTPPEDYQVPFLRQHPTQRHSLNDASLEGTMAERQTQPTAPKRQIPTSPPPSARDARNSNEANNLSEWDATSQLNSTAPVQTETLINEKPKFQPTYLPKSTQVEDTSKKNSVAERELARRLVKTKDMFLLFDN